MTAVSDQEDFRQRRSLSPVPGRRASALPHLHVSVLLLSAQWAGLHPRLWASCRETVQPQLREQSTVSVAGKRSGRSPTHPLTRSLIHPETVLTSPVHSSSRPLLHTELIHRFITEHQQGKRVPLCINPQSAAFKTFIRFCFQLFFYCVFCSGCRFVTVRLQRWSLHPCPPRSASHFSSVTEGCFFFFRLQVNSVAFIQGFQEGGKMRASPAGEGFWLAVVFEELAPPLHTWNTSDIKKDCNKIPWKMLLKNEGGGGTRKLLLFVFLLDQGLWTVRATCGNFHFILFLFFFCSEVIPSQSFSRGFDLDGKIRFESQDSEFTPEIND